MKKINFFLLLVLFTTCKPGTNKVSSTKETIKPATKVDGIDFTAPEFQDANVTAFYKRYTSYLEKVVTAIQDGNEETAMQLFREQGNTFNDRGAMERKAMTDDEATFKDWLLHTEVPATRIIVQSPWFVIYNKEYYKKVQENFTKKGY